MKNNYNFPAGQCKLILPFRQILTFTTAIFLLSFHPALAQKRTGFLNYNSVGWGFVKNEGQIKTNAAYYGNLGNLQVYFYEDKIEFVARKHRTVKEEQAQSVISKDSKNTEQESIEKTELLVAKMQMNFQNYNAANVKLQASAKGHSVNNFFLNGKKILNAPIYNQLRYINIYPHIDLVFKSDKSGLKYEFEVRPGGRASDIKLQWQGADISLKDGNLTYENMLGKLQENKPISYISTGEKIPSFFKLQNNTVTFKTGNYPSNKTLIIDPLLKWSTYFGGDSTEGAKDVAIDSKGNVYIVGSTTSQNDIAKKASYRDTIAYPTTSDIYLTKFSPEGEVIWSTYYGGISLDNGNTVAVDKNDEVYIGGVTGSLADIATTGTYQTVNGKGGPYNLDGFIAKFSTNGSLEWGTYYGGERTEAVYSMDCDKYGHVYVTGYTKSTKNIASANGHKTLFAGGSTVNHNPGGDAFLAKFDASDGTLKWGTYYGGAGDDQGFSVTTDADGNAIIVGQAGSSTSIATTGSHQVTRGGTSFNYDGFMSKFDSSGTLKWGTYYGGSQNDDISGVACDSKNNIYLTGTTLSSDNIATSGAFMESKAGVEDMFVARFNANGSRKWSTYFGSDNFDMASDIDISPAAEIFFTGITNSEDLATANAEKQYFADKLDVITGSFDTSGNLTWASYYGGEGSDIAEAIAVQDKSTFFITGYTTSTMEMAVIGSHQEIRGGFGDAFLVKYDTLGFCYGMAAPGIFGDTIICKNAANNYTTYYDSLYAYRWEADGGKIVLGKYSDSVIVKWENTGTKTLRLVVINEYNCTDSSEITVYVKDAPVADFSVSESEFCLGKSATFTANTALSNIIWHFDDGTTSTQKTFTHTYKSAGTYDAKLVVRSLEGCEDSITKTVLVLALPEVGFSISKVSGSTYNLIADDTTYVKYTWQINGVATYSGAKAKHTFSSNGKYKITLTIENENGCKNSRSDSVIVDPNSINNPEYNSLQFDVYPNPFQYQTSIDILLDKAGSLQIGLYDANGRYISLTKNASVPQGNYSFNINAAELGLKAGIYMLHIGMEDNFYTKKLVRLE